MEPRIQNPGTLFPDAQQAIQSLVVTAYRAGVPRKTLELVHLRVSQINGCGVCLDSGMRKAKKNGETDERLFALAGWRDAPYYTDAERAAIALGESMTRFADAGVAVSDAIWNEAARHFDEKGLAALVLWISTVNLFNRINVTTGQVAGPQPWED
jgi:AhpD family alkylhydroperoxidase